MNFNHWIFKFLPNHINGLTLPWGSYFKEQFPDNRVVIHELVHQKQIKELGILKFYSQYVLEYLKNLPKYKHPFDAYWNISFEIEARKAEQ